jgi:predicted nucleotidyltransferase component of viral defense system
MALVSVAAAGSTGRSGTAQMSSPVRYRTADALRRTLDDRIVQESRRGGRSPQRLRKEVAFERRLARLLVASRERWVLKGGLALAFRLGAASRPTLDIDIARAGDEERATEDLHRAQQTDLGDYFHFLIEGPHGLDLQGRARVARYGVRVALAGRRFDAFAIDVAFEGVAPDAEVLTIVNPVLAGVGLAPLAVPVFPVEDHVAQKLHAYARLHGPAGRPSTRVKDLVDLALFRGARAFSARRLRAALATTFAGGTPPTAVPPPPRDWANPFARLARQVGLDPEVAAAHAAVASFLDPVLDGTAGDEDRWEPATGQWERSAAPRQA